jgi:hypothetical protein
MNSLVAGSGQRLRRAGVRTLRVLSAQEAWSGQRRAPQPFQRHRIGFGDGRRRFLGGLVGFATTGLLDLELTTQPVVSLFTFRYAPRAATDLDALNAKLVESINADGRVYLTQTQHNGQFVIRFQVGQTNTTRRHVEQAWSVIQEVAAELEKG